MCYKKKKIDNDNEMNDENGFGASGQSKVVGELHNLNNRQVVGG